MNPASGTGAFLAQKPVNRTPRTEQGTFDMPTSCLPENDVTPTPAHVHEMALVLEGRHGAFAADVADFFSTYHSLHGDTGRCWAWAGVAETIRKREKKRSTVR